MTTDAHAPDLRSKTAVLGTRARVASSLTPRRVGFAIAAVAAVVGLFIGLERASAASFGGNSDGATVVLEGLALRHGHLLLSGWNLSFDSFWLIDASIYAATALIVGFHHWLLFVVPAIIATAIVVLGVVCAAKGRSILLVVFASIMSIVLLGLPSPVLSFFMLQGPWHIGTALWCLVAFAALSRARFGVSWIVAVVILAAGMLGDLATVVLGVFPVAFAALTLAARRRSLRAGLPTLSAAAVASGLALAVRFAAVRIGTFSIAHGVTKAHPSQYPVNLHLVPRWGAALFGIGSIPIGPAAALGPYELAKRSAIEGPFRYMGLAIVLAGLLIAIASITYGVARGRSLLCFSSTREHLQDMLLLGVGGSIALFIYLCPNGNGDYARYLTPAAIFAAVIGVGTATQAVSRLPSRWARELAVVISLLVVAIGALSYERDLNRPAAPQEATALASFLEANHLTRGVGDYWSASIVSVVSDNRADVRPVIVGRAGTLVRYGRQSAANWYGSRLRFNFLVFDLARPWRQVDRQTATMSFGTPAKIYRVGTYEVLVWTRGFTIGTLGYTRGG